MDGFSRNDPRLVLALALALALGLGLMAGQARGEDLGNAWAIALGTSARLQASRQTTESTGQELASSRSARLPQIQTLNSQASLTNPVSVSGSRKERTGRIRHLICVTARKERKERTGRIRHLICVTASMLKATENVISFELMVELGDMPFCHTF